MKSKILLGMFILASTFAYAADSCTNWLYQKPGLYWRECVDSKGKQYCQYADDNKGTRARPAPCK